jgi:hypothetical protein
MAKVFIEETTLTDIADAIREAKGTTELIPTLEMANEVTEVYEAGKKSEYDAFWDVYQNKGNRTNYWMGFTGLGWTAKSFKPKYNMKPTNARQMFANGSCSGLDLTLLLEELGVVLDTSNCTDFRQMFYYGSPKRFPPISTVAIDNFNGLIYHASIETIDKLILREDGSQTFTSPFTGATKLTNLTIEGVIGQNGFTTADCTQLSKDSITSIINALSTTTNGLTVTLSKAAKEAAFTADEWATLIATRPNWTISLV